MQGRPRTNRRSIRLPRWDYGSAGAYFVTICSHQRQELFGRVERQKLILTPFGRVLEEAWRTVVKCGSPGEFVVMPNHVHGVVWIPWARSTSAGVEQLVDRSGNQPLGGSSSAGDSAVAQPLRRGLRDGLDPGSLFVIVRTFKAASARRINGMRRTPGAPVWQRNYYERVLRDERELDAAREYIMANPLMWERDKHNLAVTPHRAYRA